jgi:hypothetical protein
MKNPYFTEVINGRLVQVKQMTVGLILLLGSMKLENHKTMAFLIAELTEIDNKKLTMEQVLESTDIEVFNYISECLNLMSKGVKF